VNHLLLQQAQALLDALNVRTDKGLRDRAMFGTLLFLKLIRSDLWCRMRTGTGYVHSYARSAGSCAAAPKAFVISSSMNLRSCVSSRSSQSWAVFVRVRPSSSS